LPLSVGDEGVVEGKERVPSPADNDAVRFSNYQPAPSVASVATSKNCRVSVLMLAAQLTLCGTCGFGGLLR